MQSKHRSLQAYPAASTSTSATSATGATTFLFPLLLFGYLLQLRETYAAIHAPPQTQKQVV